MEALGRLNQLRCINQQHDIETQHPSDPLHILAQVWQSNVHFDRAKALL